MVLYLVPVALVSVVLILLVLFFIKTEKALYDKLKFDFMDEFAAHTGGHVSSVTNIPVTHERTSRLPEDLEDDTDELEDSEEVESDDQEDLPWEE